MEVVICSGGKQGAFVLGMTGLSAKATFGLSGGKRGRRRLDDIGRGWLGRGGRVLARGGELGLESGDGGLQRLDLKTLGVQLRLQAFPVRTETR